MKSSVMHPRSDSRNWPSSEWFAVLVILVIWGFHDKSFAISTPRYIAEDTTLSVWLCKIWEVGRGDLDRIT